MRDLYIKPDLVPCAAVRPFGPMYHPGFPTLNRCLQIVIPVHGQHEYLNLLAKSMVDNPDTTNTHGRFGALRALLMHGIDARILIVDNASRESATILFITRELEKFSKDNDLPDLFDVVTLQTNRGVTHAWNLGITQAVHNNANAVCFLNSDIILGESALVNPARATMDGECMVAQPSHSEGDPCPFDWQLRSRANTRPFHRSHMSPQTSIFGSAFTVDMRVIARHGAFDPQFILLCGDTDYTNRITTMARQTNTYQTPIATLKHCDVHHHVSRTLRATPPAWTRQTCAEDHMRLVDKYPEIYSRSVLSLSGPPPTT